MIAIFHPPSRYDSTGGEGGIRTPGTRIRGTHDFQSCTFNRSVTSPARKFTGLRVLPCSLERRCLQNVSARGFFRRFSSLFADFNNLPQEIFRGKDETQN